MKHLYAVCDDRYMRRKDLYYAFATNALSYAALNEMESTLLFFGKIRDLPNELVQRFDKVITADIRTTEDSVKLASVFEKTGFKQNADAVFLLYNRTLESYLMQHLPGMGFTPSFDVCDFVYECDEAQLLTVHPVFEFHFYEQRVIPPKPFISIRMVANRFSLEQFSIKETEIESIDYRFRSKKSPFLEKNINSSFTIVGGAGLNDSKYYSRYIASIKDKMKGMGFATESLLANDNSLKNEIMAEKDDTVASDFTVIVAEEGNFDLLEFAMRQKYVTYINNNRVSPLRLVADLTIIDYPIEFLEEYNNLLKKVSFKPKKISRKS